MTRDTSQDSAALLVGRWQGRAVEDSTGDDTPVDVEIEFGADHEVRLTGPRDDDGTPYFTGHGTWSQNAEDAALFRFTLDHPIPGPQSGEARASLDGSLSLSHTFSAQGQTYLHYADGSVSDPSTVTVTGSRSALLAPLPAVHQEDAGVVVLSRWVSAPADQLSVADASLVAWAGRGTEWPEGLSGVNSLVSTNGDTVFTWERWIGEKELEKFEGVGREGLDREIAGAASEVQQGERLVCMRYRSSIPTQPAVAGCAVVTPFGFEELTTARAWADAIVAAEAAQPRPTPGLVARHFFVGTGAGGGVQVLNYSEWTNEEAHRAFLESPVESPEWRRVEEFTGLAHGPGRRCRPYGALCAPAPGKSTPRTW